MMDVIYDLLEHCKQDLGAQTASIVFGNNNLRIKPAMCIYMAQYNLCVVFKLADIMNIMGHYDYERAKQIFDDEVERIIAIYRRQNSDE